MALDQPVNPESMSTVNIYNSIYKSIDQLLHRRKLSINTVTMENEKVLRRLSAVEHAARTNVETQSQLAKLEKIGAPSTPAEQEVANSHIQEPALSLSGEASNTSDTQSLISDESFGHKYITDDRSSTSSLATPYS